MGGKSGLQLKASDARKPHKNLKIGYNKVFDTI